MRGTIKNIFWIVLVTGLLYAGYYFYFQKSPCQNPIEYRIGTLDPRFGVTQNDFLKDISQASNIWGNAIGRKLFEYNSKGSLTINLVYDTRQQVTQQANTLNINITQTNQTALSVKQQYTSLKDSYTMAQQEYTDQLAQFTQAQATYNSSVSYWNSKGGAPANEFATLTDEKNALLVLQNSLEQKRQQVNQLADEINALIDKYNLLVDHINTDVNTINNNGLTGTQFEEGVYISDISGTRIDIYQFDNQISFIRVLAHELGHALQLPHNNNPNSIMNPINQSQNLTLSPDDLQELKTECRL